MSASQPVVDFFLELLWPPLVSRVGHVNTPHDIRLHDNIEVLHCGCCLSGVGVMLLRQAGIVASRGFSAAAALATICCIDNHATAEA